LLSLFIRVKLFHAPTRAEFMRLSGIHYCKLIPHFPGGYRAAIRAAGLSPDPGGLRIGTSALLTDWARLARKKGRIPTRNEYEREGRYASASLETRFHRWSQVPAAFVKFAESSGLSQEWSDVVRSINIGPVPKRGGGRRWLRGHFEKTGRSAASGSGVPAALARVPSGRPSSITPASSISVLPPPLQRMKCVTVAMLAVLFSSSPLRALVPRRVYPDRPLLGAPLGLPGFLFEPTNEMGVILLFGMLAWRLGFLIESAQMGYPDCHAKLEVEPGRWQDVNLEFEHQSRHFRAHRHDARCCDFIICWIHNWRACPSNLQVIELRDVVRRLKLSFCFNPERSEGTL
jgi:HNH endonuclease